MTNDTSFAAMRRAGRWRRKLALLCVLFSFGSCPSIAQEVLTGYYHSAWSSELGIGSVLEVYQDSSGYLWLTSSSGIFRFDGVRFETVDEATNGAVHSRDIDSVLPSRFGGMWFTAKRRKLLLWKDKTVFEFSDRRCTQGRKPGGMWEDSDGSLWVDSSSGLSHLHQGICEQLGAREGYPGGYSRGILLDSSGTLWAKTTANELIYRPAGAKAFVRDPLGDGPVVYTSYIHEAPDKSVWISDMNGLRKVWKPGMTAKITAAPLVKIAGTEFANFTFAPDGSIWAATDHGVEHFENVANQPLGVSLDPAAGKLFSKKDGLSSNDITNVLIDRERNVWVATEAGLDRLRQNFFSTLEFHYDRTLQLGLAAGEDNSVWVGSRRTPLTHVDSRGHAVVYPDTVQIRSIRRDASGAIWSAGKGTSNLWRVTKGVPKPMPYPAEDTAAAVATDKNGDLWVSTFQPAMLHRVNGVWRNENEALGRATGLLGAMTGDSQGNIWFAFANNVVEWDGKAFHHYAYPASLDIAVYTLTVKDDHVWLAGGGGVLLFRNGHVEPVLWKEGAQPASTSGIVESKDGELWLNTFDGVVKVPKEELAHRLVDASYAMGGQRFDTLDGLPGLANDRWPDPSLVEGSNGRLWFATSKGIAWLDPQLSQKAQNTLPPSVVIESLTSQGTSFQATGEIRLRPHPERVDITYNALSLTIPERVHFRYKLEGIDKDWQDPGSRRQAFYPHLPAGAYRFKVIASNNDGVWNEQGADVQFSVEPAFYETWWFKTVMGALALAGIGCLVRIRIRQVRQRLEARHAERLSERERIARELHDTLLQDFQAAILQLHLVGARLRDESARTALGHGLDYADNVLLEGRKRIGDIRENNEASRELSLSLSKYGEETAELWSQQFVLSLEGDPYEVEDRTRDEIYQIGHEAICNAFKHSKGSIVHVGIFYEPKAFRMRISDDGVGMEPELIEKGRAGHWGLIHMRERAQKIGARLDIWSEEDKGTTLEVTLRRSRARFWRWW